MTRIYVMKKKGRDIDYSLKEVVDRKIVRINRKKMVKYNGKYHHITHPSGTGRNLWQIKLQKKRRR